MTSDDKTALERPASPAVATMTSATTDVQLARAWLHDKSIHTVRSYGRAAMHLLDSIAPRGLRDLRYEDLVAFDTAMRERGLSASSRAAYLTAIKSLLAFARRVGYVPHDIGALVRLPKAPDTLHERILPESEVQAMLRSARARPLRYAALCLGYYGGLRVAEIVGLRWRDVQARDAGQIQLAVHGKGGRTRRVLLSRVASQAVAAVQPDERPPDAHVVPRTARTVSRWVREAAREAGVDGNVSPHWLRHCHASHALDRGAPAHLVRQTLGHASLDTTSRYSHARPNESSATYLPE